jgi:hypothetical protein
MPGTGELSRACCGGAQRRSRHRIGGDAPRTESDDLAGLSLRAAAVGAVAR